MDALIHQFLYKPLRHDGTKVDVLLMNSLTTSSSMDIVFEDIPGFNGAAGVTVSCVLGCKDIGTFDDKIKVEVESHDARFLILEAYPSRKID